MAFEHIKPLAERQAEMERLCFDPRVVARRLSPHRVEVGVPEEDALCIISPCMNHRVKHPMAFIRDENGRFDLVSFTFRDDLYKLKGNRGGDTELDVFAPIIELLKLDLSIMVIAAGYRGSLILQTGFDEYTLQIEATPIARMYGSVVKPAHSVPVGCRGLTFFITVASANDPQQFADFAQAIVPSFVAVSWSNERKRRDEMRHAS